MTRIKHWDRWPDDLDANVPSAQSACFHVAVDWSWEKVKINGPYKPVGRVGHTCVLYNDHHIFVFGGYGGEGYWDDLNQLDLHTGTWQRLEVCECARAGIAVRCLWFGSGLCLWDGGGGG